MQKTKSAQHLLNPICPRVGRTSKGVTRPLPVSVTFFLQKKKVTKEKLSLSRRAALVAQNSPNRLCKHGGFGSDKTPALRTEKNLPSANFDFCSLIYLLQKCLAHFCDF
jgi:hypothetical protein